MNAVMDLYKSAHILSALADVVDRKPVDSTQGRASRSVEDAMLASS